LDFEFVSDFDIRISDLKPGTINPKERPSMSSFEIAWTQSLAPRCRTVTRRGNRRFVGERTAGDLDVALVEMVAGPMK
jgi:hypothetical protein